MQWKGHTTEADTWEEIENLENAIELVEKFEKEYVDNMQKKKNEKELFFKKFNNLLHRTWW